MIGAAAALIPAAARAQFYSYPAFQPPQITVREYNFAAADGGDSGTSLLFQWREGMGARTNLVLDAGLADPDARGANARFIIGGSGVLRINAATADLPLDMVVTGGIGGSFGDGTSFLRLPVGLSVGHRFALDEPFAVTPYAHPRIAIDHCSQCSGRGTSSTKLGVDVDLGVGVEVNRNIALRASLLLAG